MNCVADTSAYLLVTAAGVMPGTKDTVLFTLNFQDYNHPYVNQYQNGWYSDTTGILSMGCDFYQGTGGFEYTDANSNTNPFGCTLTTNANGIATGTFKGMIMQLSGTGTDSTLVTNGRFSVQL